MRPHKTHKSLLWHDSTSDSTEEGGRASDIRRYGGAGAHLISLPGEMTQWAMESTASVPFHRIVVRKEVEDDGRREEACTD